MKMTIKKQAESLIEQGYDNLTIAKITNSSPNTIRTYRTEYNKSNNIKSNSYCENTIKDLEKLSDRTKNIFIDLEHLSKDEIFKKYQLGEKALYKYKSLYRAYFNLNKRSRINFNDLSYATNLFNNIDINNVDEKLINESNYINQLNNLEHYTTNIEIGNNKYDIIIFIYDNLQWIDLDQFLQILNKELKFTFNDIKQVIHENYLTTIKNNNKHINLLDINSITNIGIKLNDYTIINSGIQLITSNCGIFFQIKTIINTIQLIEDLIDSLNKEGTTRIEVYEKISSDILHDLENSLYSDQELIDVSSKLINVLRERRLYKNDFVLKNLVKNVLNSKPDYYRYLYVLKKKLSFLLDRLYNKKYNSKTELLEEDWQKEIVEKHK